MASVEEEAAELTETLAAIRAGESIPADGLFFYVRRGANFVVTSKCGAAEVARVAIAEVEPVFPRVDLPTDVKEKAREPPDWDQLDIRATWLKNLK